MECQKCHIDKSENEFPFRNKTKGIRNKTCKTCHADYAKTHYKTNKEKYIERAKTKNNETREKIRQIIRERKNVPCTDCGKRYPHYVMDFDHVFGEKKYNIGNMVNLLSTRLLNEEIDKCEVVCANCHRIRTFTKDDAEDSA